MHNIFHVALLEQDIIRKERMDKCMMELETGDSKEYEVKAICNSAVYANKSESGLRPGLYYLVVWKGFPKKENTWELLLGVQQLKKLISCFHKEHLKKPTATFLPINFTPLMASPIVKPTSLK